YVLLFGARAAAVGGKLSGTVAPWISVAVIGVVGIALTIWRAKSTDRPSLVAWTMKLTRRNESGDENDAVDTGSGTMLARAPLTLPFVKILDMYTSRQYIQVFFLSIFSALGIFYISTFIDLAPKLFLGSA